MAELSCWHGDNSAPPTVLSDVRAALGAALHALPPFHAGTHGEPSTLLHHRDEARGHCGAGAMADGSKTRSARTWRVSGAGSAPAALRNVQGAGQLLRDALWAGAAARADRGTQLAVARREQDSSRALSVGAMEGRKISLEHAVRATRLLITSFEALDKIGLFCEDQAAPAAADQVREREGHVHVAVDALVAYSNLLRRAHADDITLL